MNDTPTTPFAPFLPQAPTHPPMFEAPAAKPTEPVKRKRGRPAAAKPTKVAPEPKRRKPRADKHAVGTKPKKAPKFDLQTILRVAATLKEADQRLFERLLGELSAMPKASRARILAALNGVFV